MTFVPCILYITSQESFADLKPTPNILKVGTDYKRVGNLEEARN